MKTPKQILSILMAFCLTMAMLSAGMVTAWAEDDTAGTGKAIQLVKDGVAANITGGQKSSVWFGSYQQGSEGNGGYSKDPIKWRVLANSNQQVFLLSDQNLDVFQYHTDSEDVTWQMSTMRSWLNGYGATENNGGSNGIDYSSDSFIRSAFEPLEQGVISETDVHNADNPRSYVSGGEDTKDKLFLLSIEEAENTEYGFTDNNSCMSRNTAYVASGGRIHADYMEREGETSSWWLRSPGIDTDCAADVLYYGLVNYGGCTVNEAIDTVRPAFNLNLESVLFTSSASTVDSGNTGDGALEPVNNYIGNDWKLTLLDSSRKFTVTEKSDEVSPGGTVNLNYTNATVNNDTVPNEYISAILADKDGNLLYYGRLSQPEKADGQISINLPSELEAGTYTLKLFSEQYNGDYMTDYASAFSDVELTVDSSVKICPRDNTCPISPFTDTDKNAWYHDGVHWAISKAIMYGTDKTTFEPMMSTTRAMLVTMLWRMEGSPIVDYQMTFTDVHKSQWYTEPIRWAAAEGIVTGYNEEIFGIDDAVTREQLATILYRSAKAKGQGFTGSWAFPLDFDDADLISDWANEAMHWMVMTGVINGVSDKELSPKSDAVRAQVATMLMRFSERIQA